MHLYLPSLLMGMRTKAVPIGVMIILGLILVIPNNMLVPNVAKASYCEGSVNTHGSTNGGPLDARTGAESCSFGGASNARGNTAADGASGKQSSCVAASGAGGLSQFGFQGYGSRGSVSCSAHSP